MVQFVLHTVVSLRRPEGFQKREMNFRIEDKNSSGTVLKEDDTMIVTFYEVLFSLYKVLWTNMDSIYPVGAYS